MSDMSSTIQNQAYEIDRLTKHLTEAVEHGKKGWAEAGRLRGQVEIAIAALRKINMITPHPESAAAAIEALVKLTSTDGVSSD